MKEVSSNRKPGISQICNRRRHCTSKQHVSLISTIASERTIPAHWYQSSEILSCSSGIGTKLSSEIPREFSSTSQCRGTSCRMRSGRTESSSRVKLNNGGKSFPFGILAPSTLSSSKNGCTIASNALRRALGVYSSSFDTRSIASADVRGRNTLENGCGFI